MHSGPIFVAACGLAFFLTVTPHLAVKGASAAELTFDLTIENGRLPANMRLIRVKQGDGVKLRWNSNRSIILHLHGYDIEREVEPGKAAEMNFVARATGRFPVSVHVPKQGGGHSHEAPVVQIEVYPR